MDAKELSEKQRVHMESHLRDAESRRKALTWLREDTTDHWRHDRIRREILSLLDRPARWITFGDGRFGTDAHFLLQHGQTVVATDISGEMLREGKRLGFITEYAACDAENITFDDGSFDWGYCKEAYHHFPRAPRALHEMLRVVKTGLVLQEPADDEPRNLRGAAFLLATRGASPIQGFQFEPSGNFVYTLSRREISKMLLSVGLSTYYSRYIIDHYIEGVEFERFPGPLARQVERKIARARFLSRLYGIDSGLVTVVIPKNEDGVLHEKLVGAGFRCTRLPKNPYL